jgi:hypothetical protein
MSENLTVRIWIGSIATDEHAALRTAIAHAPGGAVTYVDAPEGRAAIVPEEAARWWEAYIEELCPFCRDGRHVQCTRYAGTPCSCLNTAVHNEYEISRSIQAGLLKGR